MTGNKTKAPTSTRLYWQLSFGAFFNETFRLSKYFADFGAVARMG